MTYWGFHARFNLPLLLLAALLARLPHWSLQHWSALGAVLLLAMLFTAPWDNAAARRGLWRFVPGRYWKKIGQLPVEEYCFFWLQSIAAMFLLAALDPGILGLQPFALPRAALGRTGVLMVLWVAAFYVQRRRPPDQRWQYAAHLFLWFAPLLVLQWLWAPGLLLAHAGGLAALTFLLGTYYVGADTVAVRAGVWAVDERQTTGLRLPGGLPWEEAAFFYLTTLLVGQSFVLLLASHLRG